MSFYLFIGALIALSFLNPNYYKNIIGQAKYKKFDRTNKETILLMLLVTGSLLVLGDMFEASNVSIILATSIVNLLICILLFGELKPSKYPMYKILPTTRAIINMYTYFILYTLLNIVYNLILLIKG
jgi:hypothetical protein